MALTAAEHTSTFNAPERLRVLMICAHEPTMKGLISNANTAARAIVRITVDRRFEIVMGISIA